MSMSMSTITSILLSIAVVVAVIVIIYRSLLTGESDERKQVVYRFHILLALRQIEHSEAVAYLNRERIRLGTTANSTEGVLPGATYDDFTTDELRAFVTRYGVGICFTSVRVK